MSLQYDYPDAAQVNISETKIDDANELVIKTVNENQDNSDELFS